MSQARPYHVLTEKNQAGTFRYYALTHPLAGALFTGILAQSTWRVLTGKGVDWRGRRYYEKNQSNEGKPDESEKQGTLKTRIG